METPDKDTVHAVLFYQLVATFQDAAWQQLGKRVNPITQKIEQDFEQASLSIGMLDMLMEKTAGNLSDEESRFLRQAISDLKLNYVEEVSKASSQKSGEEKAGVTEEEAPPEVNAEPSTDSAKGAGEGNKGRKSKGGGEKKRKKLD